VERLGVGVVGCGNIIRAYLSNLSPFGPLEVRSVADSRLERAQSRATGFGARAAPSVQALLEDPGIGVAANLTDPLSHSTVSLAALKAGKPVCSEKPLAVESGHGQGLAAVAEESGLSLSCAPDTVLGAGFQTVRRAIESRVIGEPVLTQAFMMCPGYDSWRPGPDFHCKPGGGPLLGMGPYRLTALVNLIGPLSRVAGAVTSAFKARTVVSGPRAGDTFEVETPTHCTHVTECDNGPVGHFTASFDVQTHGLPHLEVYGCLGSLQASDPNGFGGPVRVWRHERRRWEDIPVTRPFSKNHRGLGVWDLAKARKEGRESLTGGTASLHVLEAMGEVLAPSREGSRVNLTTTCTRPDPVPATGL
jgi:predicted dehydrogenase